MIFCIDISGSMCVTSEVEGKNKFKGQEKRDKKNKELLVHGDGGHQFLDGERQDISYVTRLQCVQAAVEAEIEKVYKTKPDTKVGLVVFSTDVKIIGDGDQDEVVVAGDALSSFEKLEEIAKGLQVNIPIGKSKEKLLEKLWGLEEQGQTALGPALQVFFFFFFFFSSISFFL